MSILSEQYTLVLHLILESRLLSLLKQPAFSPSMTHLSAHPPALLTYIATEYLAPPPASSQSAPASDPATLKFWSVFAPLVEPARARDVEALVFGVQDWSVSGQEETVVEVLIRSQSGEHATIGGASAMLATGKQRRRAVDRVLAGWCAAKGGPCKLEDLDSLKGLWRRDVTFNKVGAQ